MKAMWNRSFHTQMTTFCMLMLAGAQVAQAYLCGSGCTCRDRDSNRYTEVECSPRARGGFDFSELKPSIEYHLTIRDALPESKSQLTSAYLPPSRICVVQFYAERLGLHQVQTSTFSDQKLCLKKVDLSDNRLQNVSEIAVALSDLLLLERVDLDNNLLRTAPSDMFSIVGGIGMSRIELERNAIYWKDIGPNAFPVNLRDALILSGNSLYDLTFLGEQELSSLEDIRMVASGVQTIPSHAFQGLRNLKEIELEDNALGAKVGGTIAPGAFNNLTQLEILNLSGNQIETLPRDVYEQALIYLTRNAGEKKTHKTTAMLNMTDNPIVCDCRLAWLRDFKTQSLIKPLNVFCRSPPEHRGKTIYEFPLDVDACLLTTTTETVTETLTTIPATTIPTIIPMATVSTTAPPTIQTLATTPGVTTVPTTAEIPITQPENVSTFSTDQLSTPTVSGVTADGDTLPSLSETTAPSNVSPKVGPECGNTDSRVATSSMEALMNNALFLAVCIALAVVILVVLCLTCVICHLKRSNSRLYRKLSNKGDMLTNTKTTGFHTVSSLSTELHSGVSSDTYYDKLKPKRYETQTSGEELISRGVEVRDDSSLPPPVKSNGKHPKGGSFTNVVLRPQVPPPSIPLPSLPAGGGDSSAHGYRLRNSPKFNSTQEDVYLQVLDGDDGGYEAVPRSPHEHVPASSTYVA